MNKKIVILFAWTSVVLLTSPFIAQAFKPGPSPFGEGKIIDVLKIFKGIFTFLWPIFISFAILMFIFAGYIFLVAKGDPSRIKLAKDALLWGIIGVGVGMLAFSIPFLIRFVLGV